jgi:Raf kinase inhibitor-like YbhB/YbcL family protein
MPFTLTSSAFADGDRIPREFTCDGANMPPPLAWSGSPQGTQGFALIVEDPDAPGGVFIHWVLYDIPARVTAWPSEASGKTMRNGFGRSGYGGPCPPPGHGPHRYVFTMHAVDRRFLSLAGDSIAELRAALKTHTLATCRLVGHYERGSPERL